MTRFLALPLLTLALAAPAAAWELAVCADPAGLPYSARDESGYDNRIAAILADELGADLRFVWMPDRRQRTAIGFLHEGVCDVVMGVIDGQNGTLTSHAYYRTGYVFVAPNEAAGITGLDDPSLASKRIGVPGGARRTTPPAVSLTRRGHHDQLVHFAATSAAGETEARILEALAQDAIDLAILWGPMAGHLTHDGHAVQPVTPEIDIPFLPMFAAFSVAVRPQDEALRDSLDHALAARWDDVQDVLADANVPMLDLPRPVVKQEVSQ